jgi:hypothetical protein
MNITSGHIKPCNIGQCEAHNRRSPEYLANINRENIYIRTDLIPQNSEWILLENCENLQQYYDAIKVMVKEKTGRKLQEGDRFRIDKKTGKQKKVSGSSPLREEVVVCKGNTSINELRNYVQACHDLWGITAIQIFIHRDEGHYEDPDDKESWRPNYHAHIVWDWMNHETGKSCKLGPKDMSKMQDLLSEHLHMQRGKSKSETGREHLERNDFILAKQKQELAEVKAEKAQIEADTVTKQEQSVTLDKAIADKESQLKSERKSCFDGILSSVANTLGMGKYAKIDAENKRMTKDMASYKQQLNESVRKSVTDEVKRQTAFLKDELAKSQSECLDLRTKYNKEAAAHDELKLRVSSINDALGYRNKLLKFMAELLLKSKDLLKRVIRHIIDFATDTYRSRLDTNEISDIKQLMDENADTVEDKKLIGHILVIVAAEEGRINRNDARKADRELSDVADGLYDRFLDRTTGIKR